MMVIARASLQVSRRVSLSRLLLPLLCCGLQLPATDAAKPSSASADSSLSDGSALVWAPSWSRIPPRVPLRGAAIGSSTSQGPFAVWANFAEIPRAVELGPSSSSTSTSSNTSSESIFDRPPSAFFADTQGSLFLLEPGVAVHELLPRDPVGSVDNSILSLAYDTHGQQLWYTVNTTLMRMTVSADGSKPVGDPKLVADFAPSGVQNLVVDWSKTVGGSDHTAYFCLFDGPNRTAGSLVRAPLSDPKSYQVLINASLSVLSGRPFGDAMPRYALDLENQKLYYVIFAIGVSSIDLTDLSARPVRVPLVTGFRRGSPLVALSIALLPPLGGQGDPLLVRIHLFSA